MKPQDWTAREEFNFWRGQLTWAGKWEWIFYRVRSWFIDPAPLDQRCGMGAVVADSVRCPRYVLPGSHWCRIHETDEVRDNRYGFAVHDEVGQ